MFPPAITIRQPYASLILGGQKRYETRTWHVKQRPPFAWLLHAAAAKDNEDLIHPAPLPPELFELPPSPALPPDPELPEGEIDLPRGYIIGVIIIDAVRPCNDLRPSAQERRLGIWKPGRYAYHIQSRYAFRRPVRCLGQPGVWRLPIHVRPNVLLSLDDSPADWLLSYFPQNARPTKPRPAIFPEDELISNCCRWALDAPAQPQPLNTWQNGPGW